LTRRVYLGNVEDGTVGCRRMINACLDSCDEHARSVRVGLLREEDEDVLDV